MGEVGGCLGYLKNEHKWAGSSACGGVGSVISVLVGIIFINVCSIFCNFINVVNFQDHVIC